MVTDLSDDIVTITKQFNVRLVMGKTLPKTDTHNQKKKRNIQPVDENLWYFFGNTAGYGIDGSDSERGSHDDQEVRAVLVRDHVLVERLGQVLPEEDDIRLDDSVLADWTIGYSLQILPISQINRETNLLHDRHPDLLPVEFGLTLSTRRRGKGSVAFDDPLDSGLVLEGVNILGEIPQQFVFEFQLADEFMAQ